MDTTLRIILALLLFTSVVYAAPSTTVSIPNTFVAGTSIKSADVNANNNEISNKYNTHSHSDITQLGTITTGTWAGAVIATQFGGTGQDLSAIASGSIIYFNGTGTTTTLAKGASGAILYFDFSTLTPQWLTPGVANQVLRSNGPASNPSWVDSGKVAQVVYTETGTMATGVTAMVSDNTEPLQSEGDQYMSLNITPISSSSKLRVDVSCNIANSASQRLIVSLCQDGTANSIAAVEHMTGAASTMPRNINFTHFITGITAASQTTLKVRAGGTVGATTTFNGEAGAQLFNGVYASSISITEILP